MRTFPTLYKKTSTGAIQQWAIESYYYNNAVDGTKHGVIVTKHGQVGGKIQTTNDYVKIGKNIGRSNETTPEQQADLEAEAKWIKQKKKGYVESIDAAEAEELDELIEGGIAPMLAQSFSKQGHKIIYPAYAQPKLDGIRCIAVIEEGVCTLWTRTRKPIVGVPHIQRALEQAFLKGTVVLDGELYNHELKKDFEQIVSFVRQDEPKEGHEIVEYHIYDLVNENVFANRALEMLSVIPREYPCIKAVPTCIVNDEDDLMECFEVWTKHGYEGAMVRNSAGLYVNKRSYDLQKVKEFEDAEFPIVGVEEGRGKLAGHAIFVCETKSGERFSVKLKGETVKLKEYFEDHSLWEGKKLTVKYQGITNKNDVPRFPVGVAIRDYE